MLPAAAVPGRAQAFRVFVRAVGAVDCAAGVWREEEATQTLTTVQANIHCPMGRIFRGPGEIKKHLGTNASVGD